MKHKIVDLPTELIRKLATVAKLKADFSRVSPSSERIKNLWVALGLYREQWNCAIGRNMATSKTTIN